MYIYIYIIVPNDDNDDAHYYDLRYYRPDKSLSNIEIRTF